MYRDFLDPEKYGFDRSPTEEYERKHKKHKKDKDREKEKKRIKEEKVEKKIVSVPDIEDGECASEGEIVDSPEKASGAGESLSIEETNKLRIKLGLKPLDVGEGKSEDKKDVHKPAINLREKKEAEKLRQKLKERQQKRKVEKKLKSVKSLAESDDEDTSEWVQKMRMKQKEKEEAERRAKMLEELENEFGVGDLVEEDLRKEKARAYTARHLGGLKVEHDVEKFVEGNEVVLTLKDQSILEGDEDTLVNVNIIDAERHAKNVELKKQKGTYQAYEEEEVDEFGMPKKKNILSQYDREIEAEKKKSFVIGYEDGTPEERNRRAAEAIRAKLQRVSRKIETLEMPAPQVASNYYTPDEMVAFKKPKKKVRKVRKNGVLTADDLLAIKQEVDGSNDLGTRDRRQLENTSDIDGVIDDTAPPPEDLYGITIEEPDELKGVIDSSLNRAKRLKNKESKKPSIHEMLQQIKQEEETPMQEGGMIFNATSEFCRSIGDTSTLGLSIKEEEMEESEEEEEPEERETRSKWAEVNMEEEESMAEENQPAVSRLSILDDEPIVAKGLGAALQFARSKGYVERDTGKKRTVSAAFRSMQAKNYTIEDKNIEDDKYSRRERYGGPISEFKDKAGYKPDVKLEYIDDSGHILDQKEAFRYLSHKFHGKGSGKTKSEKRERKLQDKSLLAEPSQSLDTLHKLQEKQKELNTPFVVISGSKANATSLVKSKSDIPGNLAKRK
ncbi:hypothetical protein QYM36_003332 [Artemia franciscana]|uniref:U4/U6.U5 tri-snRNP-associated protein 1 n=1 Tax=Artemia franciscana TaxID=6661 RepID=A0AA88I5C3_ARTSF|nr:hypothetical protein QYM36_003332 [Artemia franciscana]